MTSRGRVSVAEQLFDGVLLPSTELKLSKILMEPQDGQPSPMDKFMTNLGKVMQTSEGAELLSPFIQAGLASVFCGGDGLF